MEEHGNIIIYKDKNGNDNIEVKMQGNTVWLNQEQLVKLYNSSKSNISEHIKHIFEDGELNEAETAFVNRLINDNNLLATTAKCTSNFYRPENYFISPIFPGSDTARDAVGGILTNVFLGTKTIDTAFQDAFTTCVFRG